MTADHAEWVRHGRSFGAVAQEYAQLRPGYPREAVDFVLGSQPLRVLDLGAGTGLLSDVLHAAGHDVIAVDPAVQMLSELRVRRPAVAAVVGCAEHIPLISDSVDAVVAAQAAHWFSVSAAAPEIARVLHPGGSLGLVWNLRDERVPWVAALCELLEDSHVMTDVDRVSGELAEASGRTVERAEFDHVHCLPVELMVASLATRSHVVLLEPDERNRLLAAARDLFATHPDTSGKSVLEHPYRTFAYRLIG